MGSKCNNYRRAPRLKEVYWVMYWDDATAPEFGNDHAGIIIRGSKSMSPATDTVAVIPLTSTEPEAVKLGIPLPPYIYPLSTNPNPDKRDTSSIWAICNHIYTVRLARLEAWLDPISRQTVVPKITDVDMTGVLHAVRRSFALIDSHIEMQLKDKEEKIRARVREEIEPEIRASVEADMKANHQLLWSLLDSATATT